MWPTHSHLRSSAFTITVQMATSILEAAGIQGIDKTSVKLHWKKTSIRIEDSGSKRLILLLLKPYTA